MANDQKPYTATVLCQKNGGCMGCCGHNFESKKSVKNSILKNTNEFNFRNPKTKEEFIAFRDRENKNNLRYGVCRNLITINVEKSSSNDFEKDVDNSGGAKKCGQLLCPLHPTLHNGEDLRIGHCNIYYLCKTAKEFEDWEKEMQEMFLEFVESKQMDNISYSLAMDSDELLDEFKDKFLKTEN